VSAPIIAALCNQTESEGGAFSPRQVLNQAYVDALVAAGATPLPVPCLDDDERIIALLERADGLLVTGGSDFDPRAFGEQPHLKLGSVSPQRDHLDRVAIRYALDRPELPVLGICRGIQSLNVVAGGTLIQDVASQVPGALKHAQSAPGWYGTHDIEVSEGSLLREILGADRVSVNSFHHQAVREAAPGFEVSARTDDGVIEAIERREGVFCMGVQFHPELMAGRDARTAGLFRAFVAACPE
jgi:putative glutamine amidotransferase